MWLDHLSLQFTWRQIDINSIKSSTQSSKFIASSSKINNFFKFFLVWWFRWRQCIVSCSSCSFISVCHKVFSRALLSFNLWAASAQFCCSFWNFAYAATSAAKKDLDLSALSLEMSSSFFQYSECNDDLSESDRERLSEEDSDHQESEDNWDSEDENCSEDEDCQEVENNRDSFTFNEMRAYLRWWSKRAARSVIFNCSVWVVDFLHLSNALERMRKSFKDRFWLRRWDISNKNGYKNIKNINKQRDLNSFNFEQLRSDEIEFLNFSYKRNVR